jgi:hypothetical protein
VQDTHEVIRESSGKVYLETAKFNSQECVEMKVSRSFSMLFALSVFVIFVQFTPVEATENGNGDPLVENDIELHVTSPIDSDPLMLCLEVPWCGGEPLISNVTYSISGSNWTELKEWRRMYLPGENVSTIQFSMHFEWGQEELLLLRITDGLGINSTVGRNIICSRPPSVDIVQDRSGPASASDLYVFSASASDPDGQELEYEWLVDGLPASSKPFLTTPLEQGAHNITLKVTDGQWSVEKAMDVLVPPAHDRGDEAELEIFTTISLVFMILITLLLVLFSIFALSTGVRSYLKRKEKMNGERRAPLKFTSSSCDICLNNLGGGTSKVSCRCGSTFHRGCGKKEGICPECGREILL